MDEKKLIKKKKKRNINIIFLLSLIFHLSILLIMISSAFKKFDNKNKKELLIKNKENEIPASLKPRKSNFGTTVFFDDTAEFTPPKTPKMAEKTKLNKPEEKKSMPAQAKSEETFNVKEPIDEKITSEKKTYFAEQITKTKNEIKKEIKEIIEKTKSTPVTVENERIRNVGLSKSEETFNVKDKTPEIPKRKSILSMTKGFLQNIKDEGNDWSKRNGDDNKKPSIEDLKEESYNQRIHWCFQNETRILSIHMPLDEKRNMYQGFKINPIIFFILNEDGKINELNIVRSSGSRKLDVYVLKAFKGASPYPPIPKHLNRKTYVGRRTILMHR